jgi:hypothetical protein
MNKEAKCTIKGISSLLMNAYPMIEKPKGWEKLPSDEQAKTAEYRNPDGMLYVPGIAVQRCLIAAATYTKGKGRASLQKSVAACVLISPEYCVLDVQEYLVDGRPVVIPATKGRIVRFRPRFDNWSISFTILYDSELLKESEMREVVDNAGSRVGLLDFRPERKGPFGRFIVTSWK